MMVVNRRAKLHIDRVWVSFFHRGLYHARRCISPWYTSFFSVNNSDRLALSLGELEVLLGCLSPWKLASYKVLTHPSKSYGQKSLSQDSQRPEASTNLYR